MSSSVSSRHGMTGDGYRCFYWGDGSTGQMLWCRPAVEPRGCAIKLGDHPCNLNLWHHSWLKNTLMD